MPTYEPADDEAQALFEALVAEFRGDLVRCEAEITLRFAYGVHENGLLKVPALKVRGRRAAGKCKVHSLDDRASGTKDATITLDGDLWPKLSADRRKALLHHELSHIDVWDGERDADLRPRLKVRHGDWDFDGFHEVLALYGAESFEFVNLNAVAETNRQLRLPFRTADPAAADPVEATAAPPEPAATTGTRTRRKPARTAQARR